MTVLVTGGAGLVGRHVIEALSTRGETIRALVRRPGSLDAPGVEVITGDVADPDAWRRATAGGGGGVRAIVHTAALVASRAPFADFERVNVGGTRLAVRAARDTGARLVHVSSVAVYGRPTVYQAGPRGVNEDFPFHTIPERDYYARTKRMAEDVVRDEAARGGLAAVAIRPNVIYGEHDRLFSPRVIRVVRGGVVPQVGPGTNHLSCVYAGNVAAAIVAALDAPIHGFSTYNITRDAPPRLTQREFIAEFAAALGVRVRRFPVPIGLARMGLRLWTRWLRLHDPKRYVGVAGSAVGFLVGENPYDVARAQQELRWTPPFDARTAIRRTVTWYNAPRVPAP